MKSIEFLKEPVTYFSDTEFIAHISRVDGKTELLNELRATLNFPNYFGCNCVIAHAILEKLSSNLES